MRKIYILKNWNNIPLDESKTSQILDISKLELSQCYNLQWSPDGKNLAFIGRKEVDDKVTYPNGKFYIYTVPVDGGPPVRVAPDDYDVMTFQSWSPDGKWIAYSAYKTVKIRPGSTIWEADFDEILEKLAK